MAIDSKVKELIAVGASITANCQPCLEYHSKKALEAGADAEEIAEAVEMGKRVRKGAAAKMDQFVSETGKPATCCQPARDPSFGCCS
jgi:AhpD family alkylhydroperoxidase